jgi:hypothetical protein
MKTWESGGIAPPFLTSELHGGERSASCLSHFVLGTHLIDGWVDLGTSQDTVG